MLLVVFSLDSSRTLYKSFTFITFYARALALKAEQKNV